MGADEKLHQKVFDEFAQLGVNKEVSILVLASGYGALEQRLIDNGFLNLQSIDIEDNYKADNKNLIIRDLNKNFANITGSFDYIFAMEIIEHLENQFHFIRNVEKLMNSKTILFVTTPDVYRKSLRLRFLLTNEIEFFTERDLHGSGHINIIQDHVFKYNLELSKLTVLRETHNRSYFSKADFKANSIRFKVFFVLYKLISSFLPGRDTVEKIYLIKKNI
jgi:cyclopropane fatty-acyl-phospholipid synthase-like methyltransferase